MPLTDEQWLLVEPLLQQAESSGLPAVGRPPSDSRQALDAVLHKLSTGCPWYDLPFDSLSYQTAYRRYRVWRDAGLLSEILRLLADDLHHRGGLDITQIFRNRELARTLQIIAEGGRAAFYLGHIIVGIPRRASA